MTTLNSRAVALITTHGWVGVSASVINTAKFLCDHGFTVDMYMSNVNDEFGLPNFGNMPINTIILRDRSKIVIRDIIFYKRHYLKHKNYSFIIGFDPNGLIRAGIVGFLSKTPFIFHSLEFLEVNDASNFRLRLIKYLELFFSKWAIFCLTQDNLKADILAIDNNLKREKVKEVYNSPIGPVIKEKKTYFHETFGIPQNKKLVLATGSLIKEHCIDQFIESTKYWPDKFVLVLHGWIRGEGFAKYILREVKRSGGQIVLSTHLLSEDKKYTIFQSVDIGLVFFKPVNKNMKYGAASAGKLYDFMRVGVPIIGNDIPGMRSLLEDNGCGIVTRDLKDIGKALERIDENYQLYSMKSYATYPKYEFNNCYKTILPHILEAIKRSERNF